MTFAACLTTFVLFGCPADPPPQIHRPAVDVVQRGTEARVTLTGRHLGRTTRVAFDDATGLSSEITRRRAARIELTLRIDANARLGARELRIVSPDGTSNAVTLRIGDLPVVRESEPNQVVANELPVPAILCGSIHASAETDRFRFRGAQGTEIVFSIATRRIGSALDPAMTILDGRGRTLAWGRATPGGDHEIRFTFPTKDDEYVLLIHDVRFRGGAGFAYHVRAEPAAKEAPPTDADNTRSEAEPNGRSKPQTLSVPITIRGCIASRRDQDCFLFEVAKAAKLRITAQAPKGSPLDPLLEITDANGKRLRVDDDSGGGRGARIEMDFAPGRYRAIVRSLVGHGGPGHDYLLKIGAPTKPAPTFGVRFRPDTPVLRRGGRVKLWCELVRSGGFEGPVALAFDDLPPGVTAAPALLQKGNTWTTVFTLHAAADAQLGAAPLHVRGTGDVAGKKVTRIAIAEAMSADTRQAWLTVLPGAGFTVAPVGPPPKAVQDRWAAERRALQRKLREPSVDLDAELSAFEDVHREESHWIAARAKDLRSKFGATLRPSPDGSVVATGKAPDYDVYTFALETDLESIAAIRLDVLPDKSTPTGGLGRAKGHGNFVLNRFAVRTADGKPVPLVRARARFSQKGYEVAKAIDEASGTGWASGDQTSRPNWAIFALKRPLPGRTRLLVTIDQEHGSRHTLGRFRVSVAASERDAATPVVPQAIHEILMAARADRPEADTAQLVAWFRERSPAAEKIRRRIREIDDGRGNQAEVARLEKQLRTFPPELVQAQRMWEAAIAKDLVHWTPLSFTRLRSEKGVRFTREDDHVIRVRRPVADQDHYELVAKTTLKEITALRIETLPTQELKKGGAGLAATGNFVLTGIDLRTWPVADPTKVTPVRLTAPRSSFDQKGYPIAATLDGKDTTGWAVSPRVAEKHFAMWRLQQPVGVSGGTFLRLFLKHASSHPRHQLGRFRFSVTDAKNPLLAEQGLPLAVTQALMTPVPKRTGKQRQAVRSWFRDHAPELAPLRQKIQLLHAQQSVYPPAVRRGERGRLAVRIRRQDGFQGEIQVSLEGFSSGREGNRTPRAIARSLDTKAITLKRGQSVAVLEFKARADCAIGTRAVVIRAQCRRGRDMLVDYSGPIPLTVAEAESKPRR